MNKIIRHFKDGATAQRYRDRAVTYPGVQMATKYIKGSHYAVMVAAAGDFTDEVYNALVGNRRNFALDDPIID